jgi:ribokinase
MTDDASPLPFSILNSQLICCGGLRTDYIITAQNDVRLMEMGGNALYGAAGAKLWLDHIAILARAGESYPSGWIDALHDYGFDVRGIRRVTGQQDHRTFYAYLNNDERVDTEPAKHFARAGMPLPAALQDYVHSTPGQDDPSRYEPLAVTPEDLDAYFKVADDVVHHQLSAATALHMGPISIRTLRYLPDAARRHGISIVSADPGERAMQPALMTTIEEALSQLDIFMPSDQEVESLFREETTQMDARQCAQWFADRGPRIVVQKLGSDGALVHEKGGGFWHVPALPVKVLDVTGAGDSFCGGFMADFVQHGDPVRAAITGTVSASLCVQDYGALHMLRATADETDHRAALLRSYVSRL